MRREVGFIRFDLLLPSWVDQANKYRSGIFPAATPVPGYVWLAQRAETAVTTEALESRVRTLEKQNGQILARLDELLKK